MRASDNLTIARMNYSTALYSYNTSKARLDNAMGVPVDLDAVRYRAAEAEGKRPPAVRTEARLHDDALFETPKRAEVRPPVPAHVSMDAAAAAAARVKAANAAYEAEMSK